MRKIYLFLMMFFAFTCFSMAQTIENFESLKMNLMLADAPAEDLSSLTVVPNPDKTDVNPSINCVEFLRDKDGVLWDGFYATLSTPVDLTENKYVHVKVWKPRISPVMFKLEGAVNLEIGPINPQTLTNAWEELVFNFSTLSGSYSKIVFTPDRVDPVTLTADATIYFDDFYINNDPAVGSAPVQMMEDYETIALNILRNGAADLSEMTIEPNPDKSGLNLSDYVVKFLRDKDGYPYDGFFSTLPAVIDVTTNKFVHIKVWKSRISSLKFKIEGGTAGTVEIPSMSPQTKINEWEDIVFDFSAKTGTYPIIAFLPDFEDPLTLTGDITMYFDDIVLNNNSNSAVEPKQVINVDMTTSGMTAGSKVWIAGAFGGVHGTWAEPGTIPENEMLDPDGDGIYTITLPLSDGVYEFKFFWGNKWEHGDPVAGGNRVYTVMGNNTLHYVWNVGYTSAKQLSDASFRVFPNPVINSVTIQSADMKKLTVSDLLGRTLKTYQLQNENSKVIDMNNFRSGIYFISVETSKGNFSSKLIKN